MRYIETLILIGVSISALLLAVYFSDGLMYPEERHHEFVGVYKGWKPNAHDTILYFDDDFISYNIRSDHSWKYFTVNDTYKVHYHEQRYGTADSCIGIYYNNDLDWIEDSNGELVWGWY